MIVRPFQLPVFAPDPPPAPAATPAAVAAAPAAAAATPAAPAAPAAEAVPAKVPTALETPPGGPSAPAADFPADWRERAAMSASADGKTVDAKVLERMKRYESPASFFKAGIEAQNRILSGKVADDVAMPDVKTDPDGNKKWREERGIPLDATGYDIPEDVTKRMLPTDKPVLADFTEFLAGKGAPKNVAQLGAEWYVGLLERQSEEQATRDKQASAAVEDTLHKEWGDDYRSNKEAAARYSAEAIPGVRWFDARLPNDPAYGEYAGMPLGNILAVNKALAKFAALEYGDTSFVGGENAKVTTTRIAELKNIMDTDFPRWEKETALRNEYYGLLEKQDKNAKARAPAG